MPECRPGYGILRQNGQRCSLDGVVCRLPFFVRRFDAQRTLVWDHQGYKCIPELFQKLKRHELPGKSRSRSLAALGVAILGTPVITLTKVKGGIAYAYGRFKAQRVLGDATVATKLPAMWNTIGRSR